MHTISCVTSGHHFNKSAVKNQVLHTSKLRHGWNIFVLVTSVMQPCKILLYKVRHENMKNSVTLSFDVSE